MMVIPQFLVGYQCHRLIFTEFLLDLISYKTNQFPVQFLLA